MLDDLQEAEIIERARRNSRPLELITGKQVEELLGVSTSTIARYVAKGWLKKHVKQFGKSVMYSKKEVEHLKNIRETTKEITK